MRKRKIDRNSARQLLYIYVALSPFLESYMSLYGDRYQECKQREIVCEREREIQERERYMATVPDNSGTFMLPFLLSCEEGSILRNWSNRKRYSERVSEMRVG